MPHTKKESKSIEKQIMKTNLIAYDIIDNMARNRLTDYTVNVTLIHISKNHKLVSLMLILTSPI